MTKRPSAFTVCAAAPLAFAFAATLALAAASAHAGPLPATSSLARELAATFAHEQGDIIDPRQPLSKQLASLFAAAPSEPLVLPGNLLLESACAQRGCDERAAAVTDRASATIAGIAARHFRCHLGSRGQTQCDRAPALTIWVIRHQRSAASEAAVVAALKDWGRAAGYANEEVRYIRSALR